MSKAPVIAISPQVPRKTALLQGPLPLLLGPDVVKDKDPTARPLPLKPTTIPTPAPVKAVPSVIQKTFEASVFAKKPISFGLGLPPHSNPSAITLKNSTFSSSNHALGSSNSPKLNHSNHLSRSHLVKPKSVLSEMIKEKGEGAKNRFSADFSVFVSRNSWNEVINCFPRINFPFFFISHFHLQSGIYFFSIWWRREEFYSHR